MDIVKKTLDALAVLEAEGITVQQGWYDPLASPVMMLVSSLVHTMTLRSTRTIRSQNWIRLA